MGKLLIAVRSDILAGSIARAMPKDWDICTCFDGNTATDILKAEKPDALILELRLPCKDGLAVLKDCFPNLSHNATPALQFTVKPIHAPQAQFTTAGQFTLSPQGHIALRQQYLPAYPLLLRNILANRSLSF